ncbi:MAG: glutathione transferase GstA [Fimbriimonadaceae bacterium]|nr:glutathione transferase GstA [Alphaproteobacteria bacterium]
MKLYIKPGSCSLAAHIVLNEVAADFSFEKVDTVNQLTESGADYSQINPNGYVPALAIEGGEVLFEAPAILQYIADQNPQSELAPKAGTIERTRLHSTLNFVASELHKAFGPFFSGVSLEGADRDAAEAKVARKMDYIESLLSKNGPYLLGQDFTVADAYAFVVASWSNHVGIKLDRWKNVSAYLARISVRPAVVKAMKAEGLIA